MEEEERRRQQGAFNSHAQPGLVVSKNHNSLCNFKILISTVSFSLTHRKNSVVSCHDCKKCLLVCLFFFLRVGIWQGYKNRICFGNSES